MAREKLEQSEIFLERTNMLAKKLGISLRKLAPTMGLSVASLFGYRNGSIPISAKGWNKLEQAEWKAEKEARIEKGFNVSHETLKKGSEAREKGIAEKGLNVPRGTLKKGSLEEEVSDLRAEMIAQNEELRAELQAQGAILAELREHFLGKEGRSCEGRGDAAAQQ